MQETPFLDQPAQRAARFSGAERQLLLLTPGVGPMVLERMEDVGITSVEQLRREGVEAVVDLVCRRVGSTAWANRKGALGRALQRAVSGHGHHLQGVGTAKSWPILYGRCSPLGLNEQRDKSPPS